MNPIYPVYIISKGRWESRLTSRILEELKIPYSIVIEPQEWEKYASVIAPKKILKLPFSNLGLGSIPARNWVWEHSLALGAKRHWILDDNIMWFYRSNKNTRVRVTNGAIFKCIEDFSDRYENVAIAGMQYHLFLPDRVKVLPFRLNARVYSCLLVKNDLPYRWRGRYNEDTDLSLRALKGGWCTLLFNAFLAKKLTTMSMKGGNTEDLYQGFGRLKMAQDLMAQHPDVVNITWRWGRWQHHVNYKPFVNNKLIRKTGLDVPNIINNYGMVLKNIKTGEVVCKGTQWE